MVVDRRSGACSVLCVLKPTLLPLPEIQQALPRTDAPNAGSRFYDHTVHRADMRAGRMQIEKLMSGLYMGECARRLLLSFAQRADLFGGTIPERLGERDSFTTAGGCLVCLLADACIPSWPHPCLSPWRGWLCVNAHAAVIK